MAQAARQYHGYDAYSYDARGAAAPKRQPSAGVRVIPGHRSSNPAYDSIAPEHAFAFKLAIAAIIAIAIVCSARVWLSVSTVAMVDNISSLESTLVSAQARTNELEIQHSILSSSARIEQEAANIGMKAPESVKYIKVVIPGKVVLNFDGSISLSGTLQNIQDYEAIRAE